MFVFSLLCCCVIFIRKKSRFCFTFFSSAFLDVRVLHISHLIRKKTRETLKHSIIFSASSLSLSPLHSLPQTPLKHKQQRLFRCENSPLTLCCWLEGCETLCSASFSCVAKWGYSHRFTFIQYTCYTCVSWKKNFKARWIEGRNHAIMRSTAVSSVYCASTRALDFSIVKSTLSRVSELCNLHKQPS